MKLLKDGNDTFDNDDVLVTAAYIQMEIYSLK